MKRGKPLARKSALARSSKPRQSGLRREHMDKELREGIIARAKGWCDACGRRMADPGKYEVHHRKLRTRGGGDSWANLLAVCLICHRWIHAEPTAATEAGLMLHSWDTPEIKPILRHRLAWRLPVENGWEASWPTS